MKEKLHPVLENMERTVENHLKLHFFAAVSCLLCHIVVQCNESGKNEKEWFSRYGFLRKYLDDIEKLFYQEVKPRDLLPWWENQIDQWEKRRTRSLPFAQLDRIPDKDFSSRILMVLIGLIEEDSRFGAVFHELQQPYTARRPSLELLGRILNDCRPNATGDIWHEANRLFESELIRVDDQKRPRSEWIPHIPHPLWNILRGNRETTLIGEGNFRHYREFVPLKRLVHNADFRKTFQRMPAVLRNDNIKALVLRSMEGSDRIRILGSLARSRRRNLLVVPHNPSPEEYDPLLIGPMCRLTRSWPVFTMNLSPGESKPVPAVTGYDDVVIVAVGSSGGIASTTDQNTLTLDLPLPDRTTRLTIWRDEFGNTPVDHIEELCDQYLLPGDYIRQTARRAIIRSRLNGHDRVTGGDVREAARSLNRQLLDTLASPMEQRGSWDNLVIDYAIERKLHSLEHRCRHREWLDTNLGTVFRARPVHGVRALFGGPSGTGKTLAAQILASQLDMDIYRVDLSAVINKYVGETEKNLHKIMTYAEELDVILLLDEGDALLGNRTDVKSANDRYANLETNFLLQRLEMHQGIIIVTSNAVKLIDKAFLRRFDAVITFSLPGANERFNLWQVHLPGNHQVSEPFLRTVAAKSRFTGGQIRSAVIRASLLAADNGGVVSDFHLEQAIEEEYRKSGALNPLLATVYGERRAVSVEDFVARYRARGS